MGGKKDLHETTHGLLGSRRERFAFTAQVNRGLVLAVSRAPRKGIRRVNDDGVCLSAPAKDNREKQSRVRKRPPGLVKIKKTFEWAEDGIVMLLAYKETTMAQLALLGVSWMRVLCLSCKTSEKIRVRVGVEYEYQRCDPSFRHHIEMAHTKRKPLFLNGRLLEDAY